MKILDLERIASLDLDAGADLVSLVLALIVNERKDRRWRDVAEKLEERRTNTSIIILSSLEYGLYRML